MQTYHNVKNLFSALYTNIFFQLYMQINTKGLRVEYTSPVLHSLPVNCLVSYWKYDFGPLTYQVELRKAGPQQII